MASMIRDLSFQTGSFWVCCKIAVRLFSLVLKSASNNWFLRSKSIVCIDLWKSIPEVCYFFFFFFHLILFIFSNVFRWFLRWGITLSGECCSWRSCSRSKFSILCSNDLMSILQIFSNPNAFFEINWWNPSSNFD